MVKAFATTVSTSVLTAPRVSPGTLPDRGIPFLVNAVTGEDTDFDIPNLRKQGRVDLPTVASFADWRHGKTSTNIAYALRMSERKIAGRNFRVTADDERTNDGVPEYRLLAQSRGCQPLVLRQQRLNLTDMRLGFTFGEQLRVVKGSLQTASADKFSVEQSAALRFGLKKLRAYYGLESELGLLSLCLRTLTYNEAVAYRDGITDELVERHGSNPVFQKMHRQLLDQHARPTVAKPRTKPKLHGLSSVASQAHAELVIEVKEENRAQAAAHAQQTATHDSIIAVLAAAHQLAFIIDELLDGPFGEVFGGATSLAEALMQQLVVLDYNGLADEATVLIQSLMWEIKSAAILRRDHRLFADLEIHDENPSKWKYLSYGEPMARYMKRLRATDSTLWLSGHRWADYTTVGSTGSQQYQLATNMLDDIAVHFLGKMNSKTAKEAQERLEFSNKYRDMLPELTRGVWLLCIGHEPPIPVTTRLTNIELALNQSDRANDANAINDDDSDDDPDFD